ncbi:putative leader peptide [Planotetraspora sp. GP83]
MEYSCHDDVMTSWRGLTERRHIDLLRVCGAAC